MKQYNSYFIVILKLPIMMKNLISDIGIDKNIEYFKKGEYANMHKNLHHIGINV